MEKKEESVLEQVLSLLAKNDVDQKELLKELIKSNSELKEKTISEEDPEYAIMMNAIKEAEEDLPEGKVATFKIRGNKYGFHKHIRSRAKRVIKGHTFVIRNVTNFDNPFEKMQDDDVDMAEGFNIEDGSIRIRPDEICKRLYMMLHPYNVRNGGTLFELSDPARERAEKGKFAKIRMQAMKALEELDLQQMKAIALYVSDINIHEIAQLDEEALIGVLQEIAYVRPSEILNAKDSRKVEAQYLFGLAIIDNVLRVDDMKSMIVWSRNGAEITGCSPNEDPAAKFAQYVVDNVKGKGVETLAKLKEKLT